MARYEGAVGIVVAIVSAVADRRPGERVILEKVHVEAVGDDGPPYLGYAVDIGAVVLKLLRRVPDVVSVWRDGSNESGIGIAEDGKSLAIKNILAALVGMRGAGGKGHGK